MSFRRSLDSEKVCQAFPMEPLRAALDTPIEDRMVTETVCLSSADTISAAVTTKMPPGGYRRLPIKDDAGRPMAISNASGMLRYPVERFPRIIYTLPLTPHHKARQREGA